ncbi:hypothetical protein PFICI_06314 [Pestalotiopsis fici W106-1]|uniref:C2H2-type domain-containing protein n=1 Tax=Pestalotiopsis fici (strain W106-1 / CGMCC3.15140) TaxID=1229662 RepID=W3X7F5_PESFW|nr:uncharacterized protein PFICI_06314 [Pestalotiopsis fici W106-1]ETS81312.1 hypothetical protein PFICI_06314 [Pestalotiopsis fici W106-1]
MEYQIPFLDPAPTWFGNMDQGYIDPMLKDHAVQDDTAPWSYPQRYNNLLDSESSAYANHGNGRWEGTAPVPPAAFIPGRTTPYDQQSSICSSDSLPFGDSDHGLDNPATPSDGMLSPPAPYDQWSHHGGQFVYLSDLSFNKFEMTASYQEHQQTFNDEDIKFSTRASSMSSDCSTCGMDPQNQQLSPSSSSTGTTSPADVPHPIKQEKFASEHYPSPPDNEDYASEHDSEQPNAGDDDDEDYKPNARRPHKRTTSNTNRGAAQRKRSNASQPNSPSKRVKRESTLPASHRPMSKVAAVTRGAFSCTECREASFKDQASLQRHIKQQHTRPFVCVFQFAQCESTFASKNEWKRHVASQHLLLNYWLCQQDGCAKLSNTSASATKPTGTSRHRNANNTGSQGPCSYGGLPNGAIFNRKDLYTQHLRRMHSPPTVKKQAKAKKSVPEWEDRVRSCQTEAHKLRCALPEYMRCPVQGCDFEAVGHTAWDERMEHVAKHLEKAANGEEAQIMFGGDNDPTLMNWVLRSDVAVVRDDGPGRWALNNPLKPERGAGSKAPTQMTIKNEHDDDYDDEEDAPGELDD